jgi:uncharacterized surface protein with fasciclin (FAS1) repeats
MTKNKLLILSALFLVLIFGCNKDKTIIYERPSWLAGKLYTQILAKPELSTFAELVHIAGYDTIINVSGTYTVFAPSNDAFTKYFQENSVYKSITDMPKTEVIKLVKYHLVQNTWSKKQLETLDIFGWIDTLDINNNKPKGYKRETLLRGKNQKYGIVYSRYKKQNSNLNRTNIIDTTQTAWHRRVFTDSRKYAPIFFKQYFDIYGLTTNDYSFYFGRPFENMNDLYYCNGRIISDEISAENGFVYVIDRVVNPLKNGAELLSDKSNSYSYNSYYNLVNRFAEMDYNEQETFKQPGVDQGLQVDSLFNLTYPQLVFDINSEKTKAKRGTIGLPYNVTIRYHQGIVAPTDEAFNQLVNQYLTGVNTWGSLEDAPENIKRIIANSSLSINPVYQTDVQKGFLNGESDIINIDESSIIQKEYGSNCTFIGVNKPIIPRAFNSVAGPIYLHKGYLKVMQAIEIAGLLPALKRIGANYSFFVEPDILSSADSSFMYNTITRRFSVATLYPEVRFFPLTVADLRILLSNHIGLDQPKGIAKKEFIKNMAGNYLIFDNVSKEVKGTASSTYGYRGTSKIQVFPRKIIANSDNGSTYEINNWFNFDASSLYLTISSKYPKFHALLKKAGLTIDNLYTYNFISASQSYTVFVPKDSVLNVTNTNAMSTGELKKFLMMHFIQGNMIFTDGNKQSGYYETCRVDESSTPYFTVYTKIRIDTGIDKITIPSKNGVTPVIINESPTSNILTASSLSATGDEAYPNVMNTGVVHEIKKALFLNEVDTK